MASSSAAAGALRSRAGLIHEGGVRWRIPRGFVPHMRTDVRFYLNSSLSPLIFEELESVGGAARPGGRGGFLPAVVQLANVASLPGIVGSSLGMPDLHSGYGFAIGNVAAFDCTDPAAVVSPGGVGFDINCVAADTPVWPAAGPEGARAAEIRRHAPGDTVQTVPTDGGAGVPCAGTVAHVLDRGERPCVELVLADGRALVCTPDHRVLAVNCASGGVACAAAVFVEACRLQPGVHAVLCSALPPLPSDAALPRSDVALERVFVFHGLRMDDAAARRCALALARVLGLLAAKDAFAGAGGATWACADFRDRHDADAFARDLAALGWPAHRTRLAEGWHAVHRLSFLPDAVVLEAEGFFRPHVLAWPRFFLRADTPRALLREFAAAVLSRSAADDLSLPSPEAGDGIAVLRVCPDVGATAAQFAAVLRGRLGVAAEARSAAASRASESAASAATVVLPRPSAVLAFFETVGVRYARARLARWAVAASWLGFRERAAQQRVRLLAAALGSVSVSSSSSSCEERFASALGALGERPVDACVPAGLRAAVARCVRRRGVLPPTDRFRRPGGLAALPTLEEYARRCGFGAKVWGAALYGVCVHSVRADAGVRAVFDLTVPATENFVANGMVVHNCGVRLIRTNLMLSDVEPVKEDLVQALFDHIPVGVGSQGVIPTNQQALADILEMGIDWSLREGYAWTEDKEHCFHPDTPVLMSNGQVRCIREVKIGDQLVGDDGSKRTVTATHGGHGAMYRVVYGNGRTSDQTPRFECNGLHQLVVVVAFDACLMPVTCEGLRAQNDDPVCGFRVSYPEMVHDNVLDFNVPTTTTRDFLVNERVFEHEPGEAAWNFDCARSNESPFYLSLDKARAAAQAFCEEQRRFMLWEPSAEQYVRFAQRFPKRALWCHMRRAPVDQLPDQSPHQSFSHLLNEAYARVEANGGPTIEPAHRVSAEDAAQLTGMWLGDGKTKRRRPASGESLEDSLHLNRPAHNVFVQLLKLLDVYGKASDKLVSEEAAQAFLSDTPEVRAALLAGLIDSDGSSLTHRAGWKIAQRDVDLVTGRRHRGPIAKLAHRVALSIGYHSSLTEQGRHLYIAAPPGRDIVSDRIICGKKKAREDSDEPRRWPRGYQLYRLTVEPIGDGPFVGVSVEGANHHFLLADYMVVHNCEEYGRMLNADPSKVSQRAKKRGLPQLGTLGAGNHYAEVQVVEEIYDAAAARKMGIDRKNQVCVFVHSGSRGLGHQVATDALVAMERVMARQRIVLNDRQLACAPIQSPEGQDYLKAMAAAANYAWVNRQTMTFLVRQAFAKVFRSTPDDLDMHLVYDVCHNMAKFEEHIVDGRPRQLLVHRKGSTRAFPPHHPLIPVDYQFTGQPVLIGGTMGTCSYVLTGTEQGFRETFGSTCLPDVDHQVLTNRGFMFLSELAAAWGGPPESPPADDSLLFAGYDAAAQALVYERPSRLVINDARADQPMVSFTDASFESAWEAGNEFGLTAGDGARSKHVSLITTPDHDVYVRPGTMSEAVCFTECKRKRGHGADRKEVRVPVPFRKVKAGSLLGAHAPPGVKVLAQASRGVTFAPPLPGRGGALMPFDLGGVMGLATSAQLAAFMELYGYWLGDGSLAFSHGQPAWVDFTFVKESDRKWLQETFKTLKLPWNCTESTRPAMGGGTRTCFNVKIKENAYMALFFGEYGPKYVQSLDARAAPDSAATLRAKAFAAVGKAALAARSASAGAVLSEADAAAKACASLAERRKTAATDVPAATTAGAGSLLPSGGHSTALAAFPAPSAAVDPEDIASVKWLAFWAWHRSASDARAILSGLRRADGAESQNENVIWTASARFRDEVVRLCLHAGFSPFFVVHRLAGTRVASGLEHGSVCNHTLWAVHYAETEQVAQPSLLLADRDIKASAHTGRTWCVTMPSGFIIARRATPDPTTGFVTRAARPLVVGNCHGAGRAMSRNKSRRKLTHTEVLDALREKGISIRLASPKLVMEEAPESYKDVTEVVNTCHEAGISKKCVKLRPIAVIKG